MHDKDEDINDKKERYDVMKQKIYKLLQRKYNLFISKVYFNEILYFTQLQKREKRLKAYSKNFMYRRKMRNLFYNWRGVSH